MTIKNILSPNFGLVLINLKTFTNKLIDEYEWGAHQAKLNTKLFDLCLFIKREWMFLSRLVCLLNEWALTKLALVVVTSVSTYFHPFSWLFPVFWCLQASAFSSKDSCPKVGERNTESYLNLNYRIINALPKSIRKLGGGGVELGVSSKWLLWFCKLWSGFFSCYTSFYVVGSFGMNAQQSVISAPNFFWREIAQLILILAHCIFLLPFFVCFWRGIV